MPLFSLQLQELGLTPLEMGWACATQALAAIVAPFVVGQIADRWFPAERCLAVCALLSGILLWVLAGLTSAAAIFTISLALWLVLYPASTVRCRGLLRSPSAPGTAVRPDPPMGNGWLGGVGLAVRLLAR